MTIHPTGHIFVVGHADGSLAFWAVEDDDRPLLVRTLDEIDVDAVNTELLDKHISMQEQSSTGSHQTEREPIFKLSWSALSSSSDPRSGQTTLTVFGGLNMNQATGVTVFVFPTFNPQDLPSTVDQNRLHLYMRTAMRDSLHCPKTFFYYTRGTVQDYLLIPKENPHFSGTSEPIALLLLTEGIGNTRVVEAFQFPPPEFSIPADVEGDHADSDRDKKDPIIHTLDDDLASTLRSLQISDEPKRLQLPSALMNSGTGLLNGQLLKVEADTYQALVDGDSNEPYLPLEGGLAWADDTKKSELKLSKVSHQCLWYMYLSPSCISISLIVWSLHTILI